MRRALVLLALATGRLHAASNAGTTTADFLRVEQGARGIGMGGAFAALADDASSLWWNPAGMAHATLREVGISHTKFIENIATEYASFIYPVSQALGTFGGSFTYYNVPGLDAFDAAGNSAGKLTANAYAASLAYGRLLAQGLSVGANFKTIGQRLATESGQGFAVDAGLQYRRSSFGLGASVQNMGSRFNLAGASTPLPLNVRAGIFFSPHPKITLAVDEEKPRDGDYRFHAGAEWKVSPAFILRGGYEQLPNLGSSSGYTVGVGYATSLGGSGWAGEDTPWWEKKMDEADKTGRPEGSYVLFFDYAFVSYGDYSDTHRLTLGLKF